MFVDRRDAARQLAAELSSYAGRPEALVLAIPRGGIVIGAVLAEELGLPLDIILTKKIGHPMNLEYAIGVVNLGGEIIDEEVVAGDGISSAYIRDSVERIQEQLRKRYRFYRGERPEAELRDKTVILCDDGIATGNTMLAAVRLARRQHARRIVVAVPVGPSRSLEALGRLADDVVCLRRPDDFLAISQFYDRFDQVEDEEAVRLLRRAASKAPPLAR